MKSRKKNFAEKIINSLLNILIIIFGIILLVSIYTSVQTKILGNDYANFFGYSIFEVQTGSMADTISAGDCIIVKVTQKVKLSDIVTYKQDKEYITHRIIEVYKGTYITKGDANNAKDEPIDQNQIIGKVVNILPNFGILRKTLFNPSVLIALIITLFLFNLAFKKNKTKDEKTKNTKFSREIIDVIVKKVSLFFNTIIKKISSFFSPIVKKTGLLFSRIKQSNNDKKDEIVENENKRVELDKTVLYKSISENTTKIDNKSDETLPKGELKEYYTDEDELDKTSLYRVIPVDSAEVDEKFKNTPTKVQIENYYKDEDELDKTSLYRIIPVDATEVDDTLLEIAKNEIKEADKNDKKEETDVDSKQEETNETSDNESSGNVDLNLLKNNGNKKGKNIIDTAMLIKREELNEVINILLKDNKIHVKEATIKDIFITTYIDAKYYNYYGEKNIETSGKNVVSKIEKAIKEIAINEFINDYHGKDTKYKDMVDLYVRTFMLIANLEQARDSITDLKAKNEFYKKEITKYAKEWDKKRIEHVVEEIIEIQKNNIDALEYFLKKLETSMFNLKFNKLSTKKDMYGLELKHNITFSKVYSDYIIDKTYTEGIIAEDKMSVLLTLLSAQLVKDMLLSNFNSKYILYIPESLYTKEKKFEKFLRMIDDKYAKDNVIILITFEELLNNIHFVQDIRKMGYKFALVFDKDLVLEEKNRGDVYIADYIFVNKKMVDASKILSFIPDELVNNVVYENIVDKIGDFGSE